MIKLIEILENKILLPRRTKEERQKVYAAAKKRQIEAEISKAVKVLQDYQQNGSNGKLDLRDAPITQLPDNLTVRGDLVLIGTQIAVLPRNLKVEGGLWLTHTPISKLPDNFEVGRDLFLSDTNITVLPNNLKVGRDLFVEKLELQVLPSSLEVEGDLWMRYTPISQKYTEQDIREMVPGVKGAIYK